MKKILLTGGSGFLGKSIITSLSDFNIVTLGRNKNSTVKCDLVKTIPLLEHFDIVVHAAGKAHTIPKTKADIQDFYDVNVKGTANLLKGLEVNPPKAIIFISSVSVYGLEMGALIDENAGLLAQDPYGKSKIEAEKNILHWCEGKNIPCAILRLPLLAGSNPPGNLGAMIRGIRRGYYFNVDYGKARKSMVLSEDIAKIIPVVAAKGGIFNLTDGSHPSFAELSTVISKQLGKRKPRNLPLWLVKVIAELGDFFGNKALINSDKLRKITSSLTFDDTLARKELNWNPKSVIDNLIVTPER